MRISFLRLKFLPHFMLFFGEASVDKVSQGEEYALSVQFEDFKLSQYMHLKSLV